jgi:hypothetical protein
MPGPEPPRRKRFQIHLSTAIVMMVVAGGAFGTTLCGWPLAVQFDFSSHDSTFFQTIRLLIALGSIAINSSIVLITVLPIWFLCERLIRRPSARKGA